MYQLFEDALIVTMNNGREVLSCGSILVKDGKILRIGNWKELKKQFGHCGLSVIDCKNKIILPGFINAHTHVAMSVFKGLGHSTRNQIYSLMFPVEKHLDEDDVYAFALIGLLEAVRSGTTCVADHYYFIDSVAKAATKIGMRGMLGHTLMDRAGPHTNKGEFLKATRFYEKNRGNALIKPCLAPHATDTVSRKYLEKIISVAGKYNSLIHMHVSQTKAEYEYISKMKKTPVQFLHENGAFNNRFLAAHCIYLSKKDIDILAKNRVNVAITPSSEVAYEKLPPIKKLFQAGINLVLGTDCVASCDTMDIFHEMKMLYYLTLLLDKGTSFLQPFDILAMVTTNAAAAIGCENEIGSIEENKCADFTILNRSSPSFNPMYDIYTNIALCASKSDVDSVFVNGKLIYHQGSMQLIGKAAIISLANKRFSKMRRFIKSPAGL